LPTIRVEATVHGTADQTDIIQLLSDPATYGGRTVERIDTHASVVFLVGTRALKLKRAVKYDYLDFSTADLRNRHCHAEFHINSRIAPAIYRRVIPVVRTATGALALGGAGSPVDWVIEMVRFDQDALFDRMATAGRLDLAHMATLADEVASFHGSCAVRSDCGGTPAIARVIEGNAAGCRDYGRGPLTGTACDALTTAARASLRRCGPLLERRRTEGYVRECHGDLHLGNIVLLDGRPTLFDAIEFNDDLRCIDVMYDLAFLLMDLWHRQLPGHANAVLNTYLAQTHDFAGLAALPLFLSCRAAIRAKTTVTAALLQPATERRCELQASARAYLKLATCLLRRAEPAIVAIGGLSGSGKSTLARELAPSIGPVPGAVVVRSDEIRKRLWGATALTKLGPAGYTPEMSARVYEALTADAVAVAESGHAAIVDAVFARADDRLVIEREARAAGVAFAAVWLDAPERVLVERVEQRGPDVSDADPDVVRMQCAQWADDVRWTHVDAVGDLPTVQARVRAQLQSQAVAMDAAA
jgi:aminoglycoside phosphotransferase family enzyme/predicted kinase